jgi:hypothetical protein
MRFASTAWRLAGWRLPHSRHPHRRHQLSAERSRAAAGLTLVTPEGRIAGSKLLTSSGIAALRTEMKALLGRQQFPSLKQCRRLRPGYELPRRRPSWHRQQQVESQPYPGVLLRVVLVR